MRTVVGSVIDLVDVSVLLLFFVEESSREKFANIEFKYLSCHEKNQIGFRHV